MHLGMDYNAVQAVSEYQFFGLVNSWLMRDDTVTLRPYSSISGYNFLTWLILRVQFVTGYIENLTGYNFTTHR